MITFLLLSVTLFLFFLNHKTIETITYFPIDDDMTFTSASTSLQLCPNEHKLCWSLQSETSEPLYLRQDISLLFVNGKVNAMLTQWEQNKSRLELNKEQVIKPDTYIQSISFHHGEIHVDNNNIKSIQKMSGHKGFMVQTDNQIHFEDDDKQAGKTKHKKLQAEIEAHLQQQWQQWLTALHINEKEYELIPLVAIQQYDLMPLSTFSQEETAKIIGQLWEGLYKEYIIPFLQSEPRDTFHDMPIILLSNDQTHLLVVYQAKDEVAFLYQKIT